MKNLAKTFAIFALSAGALFLTARSVSADGCTTQYGGYGSVCPPIDLSINKQVQNPVTGIFVENLMSTDATFSPGSNVVYKLTVINSSGETFSTVTIKDTLPQYMTFVAGPGTYDAESRVLTIIEKDMIAGETRKFEVAAKVAEKENLPETNFFCVTNLASAQSTGRSDEDTSESCITTEVLGAKYLPVAGFNDLFLIIPFVTLGFTGMVLLKKRA